MNDDWHKLAEPFALGEVSWRVESLSKDKREALVVPVVELETVLERLDDVLGVQGWQDSYEVIASGVDIAMVKCRLNIGGIGKEDVGEGENLKAAFADALKRAALKFGVGRYLLGEQHWVAHDPETGGFSDPTAEETAASSPSNPEAEPTSVADPPKPEPQELIDRLIERLKENGLGKQAALIVTKYGGYGKNTDDTRKLYSELRALLKGSS